MLALTETPDGFVLVDLLGGSNPALDFLRINPLGKVPALGRWRLILRHCHDTLRYPIDQTEKFGPNGWEEEARVGDWLACG